MRRREAQEGMATQRGINHVSLRTLIFARTKALKTEKVHGRVVLGVD